MTLKCHPKMYDLGIEYSWGYAKLIYCREFNSFIPQNVDDNVKKFLCWMMKTNDIVQIFARRAR